MKSPPAPPPLKSMRLLDQLRERVRYCHYALATERSYVHWTRRFIFFHKLRHPRDMGAVEVAAFLCHLAVERGASASTHKQALAALLFLYKRVLDVDLPWMQEIGRPRTVRLPLVLSQAETGRLLAAGDGVSGPVVRLLYGTGMRKMECLRLRIKDVDFGRKLIVVREGKGNKDRLVMLPEAVAPALRDQVAHARSFWTADRHGQRPGVKLPPGLTRKYPRAGETWSGFWVFPADHESRDPRSGIVRRHHLHEDGVQRCLNRALRIADIAKPVRSHTLRHSSATHLLERGQYIRTIQELLGHARVDTTMIYTHVLNRGVRGVASPLDSLPAESAMRGSPWQCREPSVTYGALH
jgi:integron integrase